MTLTLRYAARSDRGLIRSGNEDSVYAGPRLLAVADGMGPLDRHAAHAVGNRKQTRTGVDRISLHSGSARSALRPRSAMSMSWP